MLGMDAEMLKGHLDAIVLAALEAGPAHGYAIIEELKRRSGGTFALPEGTVYPALHRLEAAGLLHSHWAEHGARRRRRYELTAQGATALLGLRREWRRFATGVEAVLGGPA